METVCDDVQGLVCPVLMKIKKNNDIDNGYLLTRMHSSSGILCLSTLKGAVGTKIKVLCDHVVVLLDSVKKLLVVLPVPSTVGF